METANIWKKEERKNRGKDGDMRKGGEGQNGQTHLRGSCLIKADLTFTVGSESEGASEGKGGDTTV